MNKNKLAKKSHEGKGKLFFFLFLFVLFFTILFSMPRLTTPLAIAYILYLIIKPILPYLMKLGFTKGHSIIITLLGIIFFVTYPIVKISPIISKESNNLQYYLPKVESYLTINYRKLKAEVKNRVGYELDEEILRKFLVQSTQSSKDILLNIPKYLAALLEWIFLVPLFLFFFLKDGSAFKKLVLSLAPNSIFERLYYLSYKFNKKLGDYIFAKFVEASSVGFIITSGLLVMDVRFAFIFGFVAAVTNIIPYVGPLIGTLPAIVFALAEYDTGSLFWGICILYLVANIIDMAIIFPILVSKIVDLHPLVVVISVILGSQYFGLVGMIISIPMAAAVKLIFIEIYREIYGN